MNVIVSDKLKNNFSNYVVVESFASLLDKANDISFIIFHHSSEEDINAGMNISKLNSLGVNILAYINSKPIPVLSTSVSGLGGICLEDEFYFEDENELNFLVQEILGNVPIDLPESYTSIAVITDFVQAFVRKDEKINTEFYLRTVQQAINEVAEQTKQTELAMKSMSDSALNIFRSAVDILGSMQKNLDEVQRSKNNLEKQLKEIEEAVKQSDTLRNRYTAVSIFPSVKYLGSSKVLNICEVSPCRHLTSFVLAYFNYLRVTCNKRVKLIFIHQKSKMISKKYDNFVRIMPETLSNMELLKSSIVVTDTPKSDVINKLTHLDDEVVIIVDRLFNNQIIKGQVKSLYAISGASDLSRYNLRVESTIFTEVNYPNSFLCIPNIKSYAQDEGRRQAQYFQACKDRFILLNKFLGV